MTIMHLDDERTWPPDVAEFLDANRDLFDDREGPSFWARDVARRARIEANIGYSPGDFEDRSKYPGPGYDRAIYRLVDLLKPHVLGGGNHCTRLTDEETAAVLRSGMQPPDLATLKRRIEVLESAGLIDPAAAAAFRDENQASEDARAGKIWFCFFRPGEASQSGIGRFFRYWGGEALYNSHQNHGVRGRLLERLGTPCIVQADVPIAILGHLLQLTTIIIRRYFVNRGWETVECVDYESFAIAPIPASCIRGIVRFPSADFSELTGCDEWSPVLR